jgi:hypothetical protein
MTKKKPGVGRKAKAMRKDDTEGSNAE